MTEFTSLIARLTGLPTMRTAFGCLLFSGLAATASATHTESLTHEGVEDFIEGDFENVALSSTGALLLAPEAKHIAGLDEPIVWTAVPDGNGGFYVGTGNKGKVYRVSGEGETRLVFEPDQVLSRALAIDDDGVLFVGTSPEGNVYRISTDEDAEPEVYFDPEENYIWDIVFGEDGDMFVATGARGRVYRLDAGHSAGDAVGVFFETDETHISTLARDTEGRLLAGTSTGGFLYRFDDDGKPFALLNTGDREVRRVLVTEDGTLFVATFAGEGAGASAPARPTGNIANVVSAILGAGDSENEEGNNRQRAQQRSAAERVSTVYRVDSEGFFETYWTLPEHAIHSLALMPDGTLLAGTGAQGRIFSIEGPDDWELLQRLEYGGEVSAIVPSPDGGRKAHAFTSNPAHVYELDFTVASRGQYTSKVLDLEQVSRWGHFHFEGSGGRIGVATRSGNTETPERSWSEWSEFVSPVSPFSIESPAARYFQYRIELEGNRDREDAEDRPRVKQTRLFYRKANAAPVISAVKLVPAEVALERVPGSPQTPSIDLEQLFANNRAARSTNRQERSGQLRVHERPGLATIAWQASDPNDDRLSFTLQIRAEDEEYWTTLAEDLRENFFSFNTRGFEEGRYRAKVTASDHLSNPPGTARSALRTSEAFVLDNTAPELEVIDKEVKDGRLVLRIRAEDAVSIVTDARYYLNGGERRPLFPEDGFFDSRRETFLIETDKLEPGRHSMIVVAADEAGNERVRNVHFEVPE